MMPKPLEPDVVSEPAPVARKVIHLPGPIRAAGPAKLRPIGRPWPRQHLWRDRVRQLKKTPIS
ncbi:MAG TPA: hypothetical protein VFC18_09090 [Burkholderiales bacterium]|nr:hypothetical protein [Burkholderiales bacterium]